MDVLSAAAWPNVEENLVLLQPQDIRTSWREFMSTSNVLVQQVSQENMNEYQLFDPHNTNFIKLYQTNFLLPMSLVMSRHCLPNMPIN